MRAVSDVLLFHEPDGGNIRVEGGRFELTGGIETAVYLSLFGGNEDDSGIQQDDSKQYWGNLTETDPARMYRSETQHLLRSLPAIPANLRRIEDAAARDIAWMADSILKSANIEAFIPKLNWVRLDMKLDLQDGQVVSKSFLEPWGGTAEVDS